MKKHDGNVAWKGSLGDKRLRRKVYARLMNGVVVLVVEASAPKVYPRVAPFRVDGEGIEGWKMTSRDVLSNCIEPWAPP